MSATRYKELREFTVAIYANEYKQICAWVLENAVLETGGDLFGLWSGDHGAVIQLVLGPGQNCRRTSTSFYQDVDYLEKVGSHLTEKEGVCHIGEWHSHHTIGLKRPSGGDEGTVWRNMPGYGLGRFLLFIANIEPPSRSGVSVGCFLFEFEGGTNRKLPVIQANFRLLPNESPFRSKYLNILRNGSEVNNSEAKISSFTVADGSKKMRPVMQSRGRKRRSTSQNEDQEQVTPNKNEGEVRVEIAGKNVAANEIKRRCPFCVIV